jgi:hypothetical protein
MAETTADYEAIKRLLLALGFVRPGSVVRRFMPCGKAGCRCMQDPPLLHGPYYQWTRKDGGKTVTRRLTEAEARLCREWQANHRRLRALVRRLEKLSLRETDKILGAISKR